MLTVCKCMHVCQYYVTYACICIHTHTYIYIYVCVYVCVFPQYYMGSLDSQMARVSDDLLQICKYINISVSYLFMF